MKDPFFILMFIFLISFAFKRPYLGVCVWIWSALLTPNRLLYGFAGDIRFNFIVAALTTVIVLFAYFKAKNLNNNVSRTMIMLILWTIVTTITAIVPSEIAMEGLVMYLKVGALFLIMMLSVTKKHEVEAVLFSIILGLGYYVVTEGLKVLVTLGNHQAWGPTRSIIGDNNHFAMAIIVIVPIAIFLYRNADVPKLVKIGLLGFIVTALVAVIGTYSRGGFIGLVIFSGLYAIYFKKKAWFTLIAVVVLSSYTAFAPEKWVERMDTIDEADQDSSFLTRVTAWKVSTQVALDRPLVGAGFEGIEQFPVWIYYAQFVNDNAVITTPPPNQDRSHSAHSIYFQMLGEHGFVGLFLLLLLFWQGFMHIRKSRKLAKRDSDKDMWHKDLSDSLFISLAVYMVVGAALNMAYYEILYVLIGLTAVQSRMLINHQLTQRNQHV